MKLRYSKSNLYGAGLAVAFAIIVFVGMDYTYWFTRQMFATLDWVNHTHEVQLELSHTLQKFVDSETMVRGYLLTGDDSFLSKFEPDLFDAKRDIAALHKLAEDNLEQNANLLRMAVLFEQKERYMRSQIETRRKQGLNAAAAMVASHEGEVLNEQIHEIFQQMEQTENRLLTMRSAAAANATQATLAAMTTGSGVAILLIGVAAWTIRRELLARQRAAGVLEESSNQLQVANNHLRSLNNELEAFSYSVSHDLRAPLRHINGFADLLTRHLNGGMDEKGRRYLETIAHSAQRLGVLIDDLLVFSRMGRAAMRKEKVDMNALVQTCILEVLQDAPGRNIVWENEPLPEIEADASLMRQVWLNLLANAVKYSRSRDPAVIGMGSRQGDSDEMIFFVRDNGVGFDMAYADKLFGVFQRLHRADEFEGTGIGLANVHRIILRHGGRTWAESELNEGAIFYFSIPAGAKTASLRFINDENSEGLFLRL